MSNITIRTSDEIADQIARLAEAMDRPKNWVIQDALTQYIAEQAWQIEGIKQAQKSLSSGKAVPYEKVMKKLQGRITRKKQNNKK